MDDAIPEVVELVLDKISDYVQIDNIPFAPGHTKDKLKQFFSGWHVTVFSSALIAFGVLTANLVLLIWAETRDIAPVRDGIIKLFSGDCNHMQTIFTWTHVAINILSTLLLAASNTSCQVLCAPTRKEVDVAHARGQWADIGVQSFRNLWLVAPKRVIVYTLLALSSIPLHLIYNSVLFPTTAAFDNLVVFANHEFSHGGGTWNATLNHGYGGFGTRAKNAVDTLHEKARTPGQLQRLNNADCLDQFRSQYISAYRNFLVEVESEWQQPVYYALEKQAMLDDGDGWLCVTGLYYRVAGPSFKGITGWACKDYRDTPNVPYNASTWTMRPWLRQQHPTDQWVKYHELKVKACHAELVGPLCSVSLSRSLLLVVIACNILKLTCFLLVVRWRGGQPLVTVGDSIESFLEVPDPSTSGLGPLSIMDVRKGAWKPASDTTEVVKNSKPWPAERERFTNASGWKRWTISSIYFFFVMLIALGLTILAMGYGAGGVNLTEIGQIATNTLLQFTNGWTIPAEVVFVNLPQLLLSFMYLFYNNLLTNMLLVSECNDYAKHRKGLRVSESVRGSAQRSSYWLQVPYRWAVPQLVIWVLIHWLTSQAIFLARVTVHAIQGSSVAGSINGCGYSPLPVMIILILLGLILFVLFIYAYQSCPGNIPLLSTCSVAIAAACHASEDEGDDVALRPLQYGVRESEDLGKYKRVGFSALPVEPLEKGVIYR